MPNPLIIGGLVMGGVAAWRVVRERGRVRRMMAKLARDSEARDGDGNVVVRLERDPDTGVYTLRKDR
jgi:hypothetical protein